MGGCSVPGCSNVHEARGLCASHYMAFRRKNPDAKLVYEYGLTAYAKAKKFFVPGEQAECWLWAGSLNHSGYGRVDGGNSTLAHRVVWEFHRKKRVPKGAVLMHTCDVRSCVNPAHLRVGTQSENMADMWRKNRGKYEHLPLIRGEAHHDARFTVEDVRAIRLSTEPSKALAGRYGVNRASIVKIRSRKTWKHVT